MLPGIIKQILLITDGHSNQGACPVDAARRARAAGITVSAVGIIDQGSLGRTGAGEVSRIASAGGGIHYLVPMEELAFTIHSVTVQATRYTIRQAVDQRLLAEGRRVLAELPPRQRNAILPLLAQKEEETEMHVVLLLDTSGSMTGKRKQLAESIRDFLLSLNSRRGTVKLAVLHFPGPGGNATVLKPLHDCDCLVDRALNEAIYGGYTPTGPAIEAATALLAGGPCLEYSGTTGLVI